MIGNFYFFFWFFLGGSYEKNLKYLIDGPYEKKIKLIWKLLWKLLWKFSKKFPRFFHQASGLGVKGRACVSEIELDGHVQCTLGFKENNFQTQRAAPTWVMTTLGSHPTGPLRPSHWWRRTLLFFHQRRLCQYKTSAWIRQARSSDEANKFSGALSLTSSRCDAVKIHPSGETGVPDPTIFSSKTEVWVKNKCVDSPSKVIWWSKHILRSKVTHQLEVAQKGGNNNNS